MTTYLALHVICGLVAGGLYGQRVPDGHASVIPMTLLSILLGPVMLGAELGVVLGKR